MNTQRSLLLLFLILFINVEVSAQKDRKPADEPQYEALKMVSVAHQLARMGYTLQDPLFLIAAAQTLGEYPVKGDLTPDSIIFNRSQEKSFQAGAKDIELDPYELLGDAVKMAGSDSLVVAMAERTRLQVKEKEGLPRGRKFSPLVQEYLIESEGSVKIWATFVGSEVAEVFVMGNGNTLMDLFLYDSRGRLIASDLKNIDNCYVKVTPSSTVQYRIEVRNSGNKENHCLLMTN